MSTLIIAGLSTPARLIARRFAPMLISVGSIRSAAHHFAPFIHTARRHRPTETMWRSPGRLPWWTVDE